MDILDEASSSDSTGSSKDLLVATLVREEAGSPPMNEIDSGVADDDPPSLSSEEINNAEVANEAIIHARAYQLEMLEESLKQNIIVTMDTGSGKTQVAVLRIQRELERSSPGKLVWFLAPTVALCSQQFAVLKSQIPSVQIKLLSGNDNVDAWSKKEIWDTFLNGVSIVVSTYQVLFDALSHAFVRMDVLALIVFDEAHNCVGKHPGRKIMSLYRDIKGAGLAVPAILGLTASPVMRSSIDALEKIEKTLDSVCKTPSRHRAELLSQVKRPTMDCISYGPVAMGSDREIFTRSMESLRRVLRSLDINQDPYIIRLKAQGTERSKIQLIKVLEKQDTYVFRQMKLLCRRSVEIRRELGRWAADYFIYTAITQYLNSVDKKDSWYAMWDVAEKIYLADLLRNVEIAPPCDDILISGKVIALIQVLLSHKENTIGIIFVQETATVAVLTRLLSVHPLTRHRFRVGSMCGRSHYVTRRKDVGELYRDDDLVSLQKFRCGTLELLIATSVLEEGIDVPACNLVICFDRLTNLKSFIQRRGRARTQESRLILLVDTESDQHFQWQQLEEEMKKRYEDDLREAQVLDLLERLEESYVAPYYVKRTGATLDIDQAKGHLDHFCQALTSRPFVDWRPYYITRKIEHSKKEPPQIRVTVVLPISLPSHLRRIDSANAWYTERNACKDAAFQAFIALHEAGLVNDHLMPLKDEELLVPMGTRPALDQVQSQWSPWPEVARAWVNAGQLYRRSLRISNQLQETVCKFDVLMPISIPSISDFEVYWHESPWKVEFGEMTAVTAPVENQTMALIGLAYGHRLRVKEGDTHIVQFHSPSEDITTSHCGSQQFSKELIAKHPDGFPFLIRIDHQSPHYLKEWLPCRPSVDLVKSYKTLLDNEPADVPWLALRKWPRRRDFLHPVSMRLSSGASAKPFQVIWPVHLCKSDTTAIRNVQFGSLIPSITHMVEIYLVARELSLTILKDLDITNIHLLLMAISSPAAREVSNYERLEFLGDSILKLLATVSVTVNYKDPVYPEGYLSKLKDRIVSNTRLCLSAVQNTLDKFILNTEFTGRRWKPLYIGDLVQQTESKTDERQLSTKVLADVVESIIGASFLDGGMTKAISCVRLFIPEVKWHELDIARRTLASQRPPSTRLPAPLEPLEQLLGYRFQNKGLLVEAVTHSSYSTGTLNESCMEKLEFLGDALLDSIVVFSLWEQGLPHWDMHLLRTAVVNADLLGFMVLEWGIVQKSNEVHDGILTESDVKTPFWSFMRHTSQDIGAAQQAAKNRHAEERDKIMESLQTSSVYPWPLLARLDIPKFFCDLFESVLGAVWVDSGSMEICQQMLERSGILPLLRRLSDDKVNIVHPKNRLGEQAKSKKVRYETARNSETGELGCKVFVDEELIVEVGKGVQKEEIKTKAAEAAYNILVGRESARGEDTGM